MSVPAVQLALPDEAATARCGALLAGVLAPYRAGSCACVTLSGPLGAGKSSLVRALLRELGERGPVPSPTYTLLETYPLAGRDWLHLDLYRLSEPEELEFLGLRDWLAADGVLLVEWPDRGAGLLPAPDLALELGMAGAGRHLQARGAAGLVAALNATVRRLAPDMIQENL